MPRSIADSAVVITGATGGTGRASVMAFARVAPPYTRASSATTADAGSG